MKEELVLIFAIILSIIIFGIICFKYDKSIENYSPTGWTENCPNANPQALSPKIAYGKNKGWKDFNGYIAGSYNPGSVFKCKNAKNCPNINVKGCGKKIQEPYIYNNIPIGWGSTMSGPYSDNNFMSGINGVNKASMRNPYGEVFPYGEQMYGFADFGIDNYFSS